jgi:protocatechuate 3,4-dioxygenase beta subunit
MYSVEDRRLFLKGLALCAANYGVSGVFAEELSYTPRQTEGPFYPDILPLDTDNDLLIVNDSITPAVGEITHLTGRILSPSGAPMRNTVVEIWEADQNGAYIHTQGGNERVDTNFQGFGRFLTGFNGEYYFRTIKPTAYGPRAPHIHFAVNTGGKRILTTQCYVKGDPLNDRDQPLGSVRDAKARESLIVDFKPIKESKVGELAAKFDIVIGTTPEDSSEDRGRLIPGRQGRRSRR